MVNSLIAPVFEEKPEWDAVQLHWLENHLWPDLYPAFWPCTVQLCAVGGKGIFARLISSEACPKAEFLNMNDPVYRDSCMEIFIKPFADDMRYINIEINPKGVYLAEIGQGRHDRKLISEITSTVCDVKPLAVSSGWGVEVFVPVDFISQSFSRQFNIYGEIKANVYKCGDETAAPHYSSLFFVGSPQPDFHTPNFFGTVKFKTERE